MKREVLLLSWIYDLYETYENCSSSIGIGDWEEAVLLPIAHSTSNAQIEITINQTGEFLRAKTVPKKEAVTIIPVTEDSASRGNGVMPHPLEDKLEYIAGDYDQFCNKCNKAKYTCYLKQLGEWAASEYAVTGVRAIYVYVSKGCIVADLAAAGILEVKEGYLTVSKIEQIAQNECFVRFAVESEDHPESRVYKDMQVYDSYVNFYLSKQENKDICYVTGKRVPCSEKHPSKIRNTADKSKLISSNDTSGFTYRGRVEKSSQAVMVSYEVSQKAHNALRWLIARQRIIRAGEQVVVAWALKDVDLEQPFGDVGLLFEEEIEAFTDEAYAGQIRNVVLGYYKNLDRKDNVVVMAVEAATTGRLSIPYYKNCKVSDFLDNLYYWHKTCYWIHRYKKNTKLFLGTPSVYEIVKAAYGDKNEKLQKSTIERLLPCVLERKSIPLDMVQAAVSNALNFHKYPNRMEWEKAISVACALITKLGNDRGHKINRYASDDNGAEGWKMGLDESVQKKSYLYGRLVATAEKMERYVLDMQDIKRNTSAERFFQQVQKKPARTWKIILDCLDPYMKKLQSMGKMYYIEQINRITSMMEQKDILDNKSLDNLFLLGYSCQMEEYRYNWDKKKESVKEEEEV